MRTPEVSLIIPVLNNWALTRQCLESVAEQGPGRELEILVVDNGSSDETPSACASLGRGLFGDGFRYIRLERNINFGPASNLGAKEGRGELLLFLNNDTIVTPGWLPPLLRELEGEPRLGAVGPLLAYPEDETRTERVQHLGVAYEPQLHPLHLYEFFPVSHPLVRRRRFPQALTAAALLTSRRQFEACGGFHEQYANGGEDLEFCCALRKRGRLLSCVPDSKVYHLCGRTVGRTDNESHNAAIFRERCLDAVCPDLHRHAEADGYEFSLSAWLRPRLEPPERRRAMLGKRLGWAGDAEELRELLLKEPLWSQGRLELVRILRQAGELREAARQAFIHAKFRQSPRAFELWRRLAGEAGDEKAAQEADRTIRHFQAKIEREGESLARFMAGYMRKLGGEQAAREYERRLAEMAARAC